MTRGEAVLAVAAREIGYHEGAGKHNKYGEWYASTFSPSQPMWDGVAWCMEFVQWVYHQCGADLPYKTASCGELLNWYKRNQPECIVSKPVRGCIVIFDFPGTAYSTDHTGLYVKSTELKITTIDGNTSGGSDSNGGWVQQKTRTWGYANPKFIVPRGLEEEIMQRYNTMHEISDECPWATETVAKLIETGAIRGGGLVDAQGRPADMDLSRDMLRLLVINDRAGCYKS